MRKKILATFLVLCMVLGMLPTMALAEDSTDTDADNKTENSVASVTTTNNDGTATTKPYGTLTDAFTDADGKTATITLLGNTTVNAPLIIKDNNSKVTLDLNGNTITLESVSDPTDTTPIDLMIRGGTFTLEDSSENKTGEIKHSESDRTKLTIYVTGTSAFFNMTGGTVTGASNGNYGAIYATKGATVNISGGTVTDEKVAIKGKGEDSSGNSWDPATINITGGTIQSKSGTTFDCPSNYTLNIIGGTFSSDPTTYVAKGYVAVANEAGTYTVEPVGMLTFTESTATNILPSTTNGTDGKEASELQSSLEVKQSGNAVTVSGTAALISGWTGFSATDELQSGYYIALNMTKPNAYPDTASGTIARGDSDGKSITLNFTDAKQTEYLILRIADSEGAATSNTFILTVTAAGTSQTYTIDVSGVTLAKTNDNSSSDETYYVSTPGSVTGGTVSAVPSHAKAGRTVTLIVKPDDGYEIGDVTVTSIYGKNIKVTDMGDGKYTFTMPDCRVEVDVTFVEIDDGGDGEGTGESTYFPTHNATSFTDISSSAYYYNAVLWAVENGITTGTSATTFSPDMSCTRAQMVTFLWRAAGSPVVYGANPFTDVQAGTYYYDAVLWAVSRGITTGTSATTFSPDDTVSRAQTVTFLWRYAGSPAAGGSSFADVTSSAYYASAVQWAVNTAVTTGTSATMFSPDNDCTRAQIVTFLYRDLAK